jgi:hypothetical protein
MLDDLALQSSGALVDLGRGLALLHGAQSRFDALGQPFTGVTSQTLHGFLNPPIGADPVADGLLCRLLSQGQRRRVERC